MKSSNGKTIETRGYAPVNGLKMYYEIEGTSEPLVYIPPVFGYAGVNEFPTLRRNRQVITMDLQGHGRTADNRIDWPRAPRMVPTPFSGILCVLADG